MWQATIIYYATLELPISSAFCLGGIENVCRHRRATKTPDVQVRRTHAGSCQIAFLKITKVSLDSK